MHILTQWQGEADRYECIASIESLEGRFKTTYRFFLDISSKATDEKHCVRNKEYEK